jgi:hypothetical protein
VDEVLSSIVVEVLTFALEDEELSSTLVEVWSLKLVDAERLAALDEEPLASRLVDVLGAVELLGESSAPLAHAIPAMSRVAATTPPIVAAVLFGMMNLLGFWTVQACGNPRYWGIRRPSRKS